MNIELMLIGAMILLLIVLASFTFHWEVKFEFGRPLILAERDRKPFSIEALTTLQSKSLRWFYEPLFSDPRKKRKEVRWFCDFVVSSVHLG